MSHRGTTDTNLTINRLTLHDNGKLVSCQLVNNYTVDKNATVISEPVTLNIEYSPIIELNTTSPLTVNETDSISVLCSAMGNPEPDHPSWNGTSNSMLRFDNISRTDKRTYICSVVAISRKHGTLRNKTGVDILVQYAPDLNVTITGSNHPNMTSNVTYEASGFLSKYTFHPWKQMFGGVTIRSRLHGNPKSTINPSKNILTLDRLSMQDMGTYVCSADNGIRGINGDVIQAGAVVLNVKGKPDVVNRKDDTFTGEIGSFVNMVIPFYSDPVIMDFKFQRNGSEVKNTSRTTMYLRKDIVDFMFYKAKVKLEVQTANMLILNLTEADFNHYILVLENSLGQTEFELKLDAAGTGEEKNPSNQLTLPVVVGMWTGIAVLIVTIIALVIVILRKKSNPEKPQYGNAPEENEAPGYEVGRGVVPIGEHNIMSNEYEGLRNDAEADNPYQELQELYTANQETHSRSEVGRLILQAPGNNATSNEYENPASINAKVHSYLEPLDGSVLYENTRINA